MNGQDTTIFWPFQPLFWPIIFKLRKGFRPELDFKIKVYPKGPPSEPLFGWVWRTQTIRGARGDHFYFLTKIGPHMGNLIAVDI